MPDHIVHPISYDQLKEEELIQWADFRSCMTELVKGLREPSSAALEQANEPTVADFDNAQEERKSIDSDMNSNSNSDDDSYTSDE